MANTGKQLGNQISFTKEDVELLKEFQQETLSYMIDHIDAVIAGDVSGFIAGAVDAVLPAKGKQVLEEGVLEGILGK